MSPQPLNDPNDALRFKLGQLADAALNGELSEWEYDFVLSVGERFDKGIDLTDAQLEKVNQIWEKL